MSMSELLRSLEAAGIPIDDLTKSAMIDIDPGHFTDYDLEVSGMIGRYPSYSLVLGQLEPSQHPI